MEFAHPFFRCGEEGSLELIKRKISAAKTDDSRGRPENFNQQVLIDVRQMKGKQETMDNKLLQMKRENDALWRELSVLRQKHVKQQQIVSKLLQFLVSMMSTQSHRIGFKRRLPLMLADSEDQKSPKQSRPADTGEGSPQGPVIQDVTGRRTPHHFKSSGLSRRGFRRAGPKRCFESLDYSSCCVE